MHWREQCTSSYCSLFFLSCVHRRGHRHKLNLLAKCSIECLPKWIHMTQRERKMPTTCHLEWCILVWTPYLAQICPSLFKKKILSTHTDRKLRLSRSWHAAAEPWKKKHYLINKYFPVTMRIGQPWKLRQGVAWSLFWGCTQRKGTHYPPRTRLRRCYYPP